LKVLIAEDDSVTRRLLQSYLQRWGHDVTAAQNGAEAWRLFEGGTFGMVISDWIMPEMDGLELISRIRSCRRAGYVYMILLTSKSQKEDIVQGMEVGADDFVTKPFDRDELRVRVRAGERIVELESSLEEQNRALREAKTELSQQEKLASKGQLVAELIQEIGARITAVADNLAVVRQEALAHLKTSTSVEDLTRRLDESLSELSRLREIVRKYA